MIFRSFSVDKTKSASTAETLVATGTELDSRACAFHLDVTGTAQDYDATVRHRVKASGRTLWDCSELQLAALLQRLARQNLGPAASATRWTIPLYIIDYGDDERKKYSCGFPQGEVPQVEVEFDNTGSGAGRLRFGQTISTEPYQFYSMFLASAANIGASVTNGTFPISSPAPGAMLRAITIPDSGDVTRTTLRLNGVDVLNLSSAQLLESQQNENGTAATANICVVNENPVEVGAGSMIILETGSGFGGAAEEIGLYWIVPQRR